MIEIELREVSVAGQHLSEVALGAGQFNQLALDTGLTIKRSEHAGPEIFCAADHERHRAGRDDADFHVLRASSCSTTTGQLSAAASISARAARPRAATSA